MEGIRVVCAGLGGLGDGSLGETKAESEISVQLLTFSCTECRI